jgi:hypothetical protein
MKLFFTYIAIGLLLAPNVIVLKHYVDKTPMLKYLQGSFTYIVFLLAVHVLVSIPLARILVGIK